MLKEFNFGGEKRKVEIETDADLSVFGEVFVDNDYRVLGEMIADADCILDLGAHLGFFSLYCAFLNKNARIFAYEPDERNFSLLKKNLKLNQVENVKVKNLAVGASSGQREFYVSGDSHNHSLGKDMSFVEVKKVNVLGFSDLMMRMENCDLVKMDIEGAEFEILENVPGETLQKVKNIYIEYHEFNSEMKAEALMAILQKNGFKVKKFSSHYDEKMGFILAKS